MYLILLTKNSTPIIGWIARLLGFIMDGIFSLLDLLNIPNIGLAIILFTIVVNLLMLPLTIKQQKFSKLSAKMNPEIQAINAKYKNKTDNESRMAQQQEIQAIYAKYGVSAGGSCLQLLIQMPILFALYRVIQSIPAYVNKIGNVFGELAKVIAQDGAAFLKNSDVGTIQSVVRTYGSSMNNADTLKEGIIDVLNKLSSTDLAAVADHYKLTQLTYPEVGGKLILGSDGLINTYNNFLGLNMGDSPSNLIQSAWGSDPKVWGIIIGALLIPILSALTQWINVKLMPQAANNGNGDNASSMASSMKMMNTIMPLFSAWLCFSFPSGLGLYWVAGSVVRCIQQVVINKHFDKMDFDEIIKQNSVKSAKKMEKLKKQQEMLNNYANMNTRNIQSRANSYNNPASDTGGSESSESSSSSSSTDSKKTENINPKSITAKANLVKQYNERNNSK
ncbi:MAG: YidC/Oxa1 family membrane protein insertase [Acetatifactor sp.]|nr:YidC/Oxa1 family membrane protein insertase [Acetatifactor sp.]